MTVVIVLINSTNNDELEIVSISNINNGIVLEDLKQISNLNSNEQFVILNIWASWCIPCQNEVSELKILSETQGYSVIGILVEDSEENGKEFIKNNDISYQNILDNITGITISPKKSFCILKIWLSSLKYQNVKKITEIKNLPFHGCICKKHKPDY